MISNPSNRVDYTGNGSVSVYTFSFPITQASDLVVLETTAGVTTTMLLTTDYTVTQNQDTSTGGSITLVAGNLANGTALAIIRVVPLTQTFSFQTQGSFDPSQYEAAIDQLCMMIQQLQQQINVCLRYPQEEVPGTFTSILPQSGARSSKALTFDSSGNAVTT